MRYQLVQCGIAIFVILLLLGGLAVSAETGDMDHFITATIIASIIILAGCIPDY